MYPQNRPEFTNFKLLTLEELKNQPTEHHLLSSKSTYHENYANIIRHDNKTKPTVKKYIQIFKKKLRTITTHPDLSKNSTTLKR